MEVEASSCIDGTTGFHSIPLEQMAALEVIAKAEPRLSRAYECEENKVHESTIKHCQVNPVNDATEQPSRRVVLPDLHQPRPSRAERLSVNDIGKYRLLRTIGKGNFAKVKLAVHIATGAEVAIKIINKTVMDATLLRRLKREIIIMKRTNHPNIVRLLEIIENEDVLCLVMDYASGGEIFDYLVANGKMREKEARIKFRQLLSAIQYCHSKRIVHRDLKAENILLDRDLNVKVADFGFANTFDYDQRLKTFCGSPPYAAPELFMGIPYYGPGVDVWSLGVILFALVLGHLPFDARDLHDLRKKIIGLNYTIPKGSVSSECEALLRKMLVLDPKDRASLKFFMQDKWVNLGYAPNEVLRPYREPPKANLDEVRVEAMLAMGFTLEQLESSVVNPEFDHVYATYHLIPEVPSPFAALFQQSPQQLPRNSLAATLPNALIPPRSSQKQSITNKANPDTAVGRFTVVPSTANVEVQPSTKRSVAAPSSNQPTSVEREHHSLTSAFPLALRRAVAQVGRTLGGQQSSVTSSHTQEANSRSVTQAATYRGPAKNAQKRPTDGRPTITTAPVPIPGARKSHPPQRVSPSPVPCPTIERPLSSSGSSAGTTPPRNVPIVIQQVSSSTLPKAEVAVKKRTPKQSPLSQSPVSSSKKKMQVVSTRSSPTANPTEKVKNNKLVKSPSPPIAGSAGQDAKSVSSSSASDASGGPTGLLPRKSASIVGDLCLTDGIADTPLPVDQPCLNQQPTIDRISELRKQLDASVPFQGVAQSPISTTDEQITPIISPTHSTWAAHTVQGNEGKVLSEEFERLKRESTSRPSTMETPDSSIFTVDHNHTNTWTRGVFKALGGMFTPGRSHDSRTGVSDGMLSGPREVRFPWSVHTTSIKTAPDVMKNILQALEVTPGCRYAFDHQLPFLIRCSWAADRAALTANHEPAEGQVSPDQAQDKSLPSSMLRDDPVLWEMEVCQLPRLHLRGVRLKRIRGSALQFRRIADLVMKSLHL